MVVVIGLIVHSRRPVGRRPIEDVVRPLFSITGPDGASRGPILAIPRHGTVLSVLRHRTAFAPLTPSIAKKTLAQHLNHI